ncbi:MAG: TnpV protein [Oscillospiraceae bacterium]
MDKYIFDESNGLWYELQGDYYIPCLILSEEETQPIGLWGQRHKQYLKEHKQFIYTTMLIEGTLNRYLADINQQAEQMFHRLIAEIAEKQGITEKLKAENQMEWVRQMNACKAQTEEVIKTDLIYN